MSKSLDDIFREEEDAAIAKHKAWLADPVAQAAHKADMATRQAALDAAYEAQVVMSRPDRIAFLKSQLEDLHNEHDGDPETQREIEDLEADIAELQAEEDATDPDDEEVA